ncbi:MAG: DNA repair protein RadC [Actinomycetota bacterium]|nr:DNA repair protein RadC [Actinomycetota bacterium]
MTIKVADLPAGDRPRERLLRTGAAALREAELLALVIRSGGPSRNAIYVAEELLASHGSFERLASASPEELSRTVDLGTAKVASLLAAFEIGRRIRTAGPSSRRIGGPEDIAANVRPHIVMPNREEAFVVVVNGANRLIRVERLSCGGADRCLMQPRDVLATVLRHDGLAFGVAHTHPGGDPRPSPEDVRVTNEIDRAARPVGLRFLDHVVLCDARWVSLRRLELIQCSA